MIELRRLLGKVRSLFGSREEKPDFENEIADHLKLLTARYISQGMSPEQANQAARRQFGNTTLLHEDRRALETMAIIDAVGRDLRYASRMLRKRPTFTVAAVLTLGLVIGANGAIFSVLQAVLLRPLPFFKPGQLVLLFCKDESAPQDSISPVDLEDWSRARAFQSVSALQGQSANLTDVEEPARLVGSFVSSTFFPMLGIHPARGRFFTKAEDQPGAARVCVVSFGLWQGRFGGDPHLVGRSLTLNGELYTIAGILPDSFRDRFFASDVWLPIWAYPNYVRDRRQNNVFGIARLSDGIGLQQARAELATITKQLATQYPDTNRSRSAVILPLHETLVEDVRPILLLLAGAVACVLLIGCANVAALQLTQAFGRRQELAVRASLGAGRGRLMVQLLTESCVLGSLGGLCGLGIAAGGIRLITAYADNITVDMPIGLNTPVLIFLLLVSLLTGVLFGLAPAWFARKEAVNFLRVRGPQRAQGTIRGMLVTTQVALALVLLASAGLLLKSLQKLISVDPGFKTDHLLTLEYRVPRNKYPKGAQQTRFHEQVVEKTAALPGVESAADIGLCLSAEIAHRGSSVSPIARPLQQERPGLPVITRFRRNIFRLSGCRSSRDVSSHRPTHRIARGS